MTSTTQPFKVFTNGNLTLILTSIAFIVFAIGGNQYVSATTADNATQTELRAAASEVQTLAYGFYYDKDHPKRPTTPERAAQLYNLRNKGGNITVEVEEKDNCFTVSATHKKGKTLTMEEVCEDQY